MLPEQLPKKNNRTPPVVDPVLLRKYREDREKYWYLGPESLVRHRREQEALETWARSVGISKYNTIQLKKSFEYEGLRFRVKTDYDPDGSVFATTFGPKGRAAHLGEARQRPWVGKHVVLPSGQRVWVPEDNPRARDIGINCNSLDLSKLPGYDSRSYRWANSQETYNDLFSGWWEQGYSKKECDLKARKSWYEKIQSDRDNEVSYHYILVDVFYDLTGNGDTIEVASESLGGVDNTDDYLLTSIKEVCDTALASAKEKLPELLGKIRARLDATGLVTQTQGGP